LALVALDLLVVQPIHIVANPPLKALKYADVSGKSVACGTAFLWLGIDVGADDDSRPLRKKRARGRHIKKSKLETARLGKIQR
jgi:hypothetical protein